MIDYQLLIEAILAKILGGTIKKEHGPWKELGFDGYVMLVNGEELSFKQFTPFDLRTDNGLDIQFVLLRYRRLLIWFSSGTKMWDLYFKILVCFDKWSELVYKSKVLKIKKLKTQFPRLEDSMPIPNLTNVKEELLTKILIATKKGILTWERTVDEEQETYTSEIQ